MIPEVSVIVPVYNASKYIKHTIEKILNQTKKEFELILVVDGANDGSYEICQNMSSMDNRIILVFQDNQGISAARNKGISIAKAEYIVFVDHDDLIDENLLMLAVEKINNTKSDFVKYGVRIEDVDATGRKKERLQEYEEKHYSYDDLKNEYVNIILHEMDIYVWDGIYRKDFLIKNEILFDERYKYGGEDIAFNISLFCNMYSFDSMAQVLYHHFNRESQSTSLINRNQFYDNKKMYVQLAGENLFNRFSFEDSSKIYTMFVSRVVGRVFYQLVIGDNKTEKEKKEIIRDLYGEINWEKIDVTRYKQKGYYWPWLRMKLFRNGHFLALQIAYVIRNGYRN